MKELKIGGTAIAVEQCGTVVFGSGAAGLCCVKRLADLGVPNVRLLTNGIHMGTSRNTGSDKQTYYKLNVSGSTPDSILEVAQTLFDGGACDGDTALVEAALSARCFYHLADLGVPFVRNEYGEFVGYKTDHDPKARAASAGPLTVQEMCAALYRAVEQSRVPVTEGLTPVQILTEGGRVQGILCLWQSPDRRENEFWLYLCENLVMATGAPASLYEKSVFPESQLGAGGVCFAAGAKGKNLTEWQYGLASTGYRWNVSGSYQQVLPRYISRNPDGSGEREFLPDGFRDTRAALAATFLKGYQWPFDVTKLTPGASSWVDLLVYRETVLKGRKVYLDYTRNPFGMEQLDEAVLSPECLNYLRSSGAMQETPYERLAALNPDAVKLYLDHGIDLSTEPLEIDVCAQHNNGGLAGDMWWETDIRGLFAIGEANGSHGVRRPGGSALNAGQAGAFRCAEKIAAGIDAEHIETAYEHLAEQVQPVLSRVQGWLNAANSKGNLAELSGHIRRRNSAYAGFVRNRAEIRNTLDEIEGFLTHPERIHLDSAAELPQAFGVWDLLVCTKVYLTAMLDYIGTGALSRGSALLADCLPEPGEAVAVDTEHLRMVQEACYDEQTRAVQAEWRAVRPIPDSPQWFEQVWKDMKRKGVAQ